MLSTVGSEEKAHPSSVQTEDARIVELAAAAARGSDAAFVDLYEAFSLRLFNLVLRNVHDRGIAEDLCQEIWLKVHHEIRGLRSPEAIRSWLYRIASRACIDFSRSSRSARISNEKFLEEVAQAYDPLPEDAAIQGSQVRMVWETLATMAPRQSIALYLKQVDGRSYDEIGSILNCSRETVESLLYRARQSFARTYNRVQSSPVERCSMFQHVVADVIDHEPTPLQKSAIHAHMQECRPCRMQLPDMAIAAKRYGILPLLPLTKSIVFQTILGGAAAGTAVGLGPASTGGVIAGLTLKAKLAALFGLLAVGATGATSTQVVGIPLIPDFGGILREDTPQDAQPLLLGSHVANDPAVRQGLTDSTQAAGPTVPDSAVAWRAGSSSNTTPGNDNENDSSGRQPVPPAASSSSNPTSSGSTGGTGGTGGSGASEGGGPGGLLPPDTAPPLGTLLQDSVGTLGGIANNTLNGLDDTLEDLDTFLDDTVAVVDDTLADLGATIDNAIDPVDLLEDVVPGNEPDGVVDDTLDEVLSPDDDSSGPVDDLINDVDDTLDVLPGEEEEGDGLLGGVLDPLLGP